MIKLNDTGIYVGQIKQLLHTFNLPQCQVGNVYPKPNSHFLLKDNIMYWDADNKAQFCDKYVYGYEYLNLTSTLPIKNLLYDRETHQYLGSYLRFLRDYFKIDLMSMYNCCDNTINTNTLEFTTNVGQSNEKNISFRNGDNNCTVYKVPVSISKYTIATHCQCLIEVCVYIENTRSEYEDIISTIARDTYVKRKINGMFTYNPFEKTFSDDVSKFMLAHADEVKILIKVTEEFKNSLVVLEGEYINDSRKSQEYFTYKPMVAGDSKQYATLLAYRQAGEGIREPAVLQAMDSSNMLQELAAIVTKPVTARSAIESRFDITSQLLTTENTNGSYLLADRLLEYLVFNVITPLSEHYEIKRLQKTLDVIRSKSNIKESNLNISDINYYRDLYKDIIKKQVISTTSRPYGIWYDADLYDLRSIIKSSAMLSNKYDSLGYLDKDLETILKGVLDNVTI